MSNERDELALTIMEHPWLEDAEWPKGWCPKCDRKIDAGYNSPCHANHVADAILAAGYRRPRTITTVKQLKDEHAGLVVIDGNGMVWKIDGKYDHWVNIEEGDSTLYGDEDIPLPVTVLHEAVTE